MHGVLRRGRLAYTLAVASAAMTILLAYYTVADYQDHTIFRSIPSGHGKMMELVLDSVSDAVYDARHLKRIVHERDGYNTTIEFREVSLVFSYRDGRFYTSHPYSVERASIEIREAAGPAFGLGIIAVVNNVTQVVHDPRTPFVFAAYRELRFSVPLEHSIVFRYEGENAGEKYEFCLGSPTLIVPVIVSWEFPRVPATGKIINLIVLVAVYNESGKLAYSDYLGLSIGSTWGAVNYTFTLPEPNKCSTHYSEGAKYYGVRYLGDADGDGYTELTVRIYVAAQKPYLREGHIELKIPRVALVMFRG